MMMSNYQKTKKIEPGDVIDWRELPSISGRTVAIPDAQWLVHLQVRRLPGVQLPSAVRGAAP
jgi:hypothetical protein